jgi:hypothetical protein
MLTVVGSVVDSEKSGQGRIEDESETKTVTIDRAKDRARRGAKGRVSTHPDAEPSLYAMSTGEETMRQGHKE